MVLESYILGSSHTKPVTQDAEQLMEKANEAWRSFP